VKKVSIAVSSVDFVGATSKERPISKTSLTVRGVVVGAVDEGIARRRWSRECRRRYIRDSRLSLLGLGLHIFSFVRIFLFLGLLGILLGLKIFLFLLFVFLF
jgi:hypothetical protein